MNGAEILNYHTKDVCLSVWAFSQDSMKWLVNHTWLLVIYPNKDKPFTGNLLIIQIVENIKYWLTYELSDLLASFELWDDKLFVNL